MKLKKGFLWAFLLIVILSTSWMVLSSTSTVLLGIKGTMTDGNLIKLSGVAGVGEDAGVAASNVTKNKFDATSAPTVNNDTDEGYVVGSRWVDITNDKEYVCLDNTDGAAVWTETTGAGGGAGTYLELTDTPAAYDNGKYAKSTADGVVWDTPAGAGTVTTSGTPVQYDFARFTDATTIEGRSYSEVKTDLALNNVTNDAQIAKSIGTAQGDLIYFTASATPTVLAKGTATQVLAMNAGATAPEWVAAGAGGYTNLTSFVDQTAWRLFYSNTDGDVTELALGADGTYLKSNGAAAAPTFSTPSGAGDALTTDGLDQFAATTSAELAGVISDEIGAGKLRFDTSVTAKTTTATLNVNEAGTILVSAASAYTITLPTPVDNVGLTYKVKKTDFNYNLITMATTAGQFMYENADSALKDTYPRLNTGGAEATFIADGSNWQVVDEAMGQVPEMKACLITAAQLNLVHGTNTLVELNHEVYDIGSNFSTDTHKFICPIAGKYMAYGNVSFTHVIAYKRYHCRVNLNASAYVVCAYHASCVSDLYTHTSILIPCSANDEITLYARSDSGDNTVDIAHSVDYSYTFLVVRLISKD